MHTMKAVILLALLAGPVLATPATDRNFATKVEADLQSAGPQSLPDLAWQQGTTPRLSIDQVANGKAVTADTGTTTRAILIFGPTATSAYFVAVTNYAASGNGYLIDVPTVGTNTAAVAAGWWYTCYLEQTGKRFWTGNGRLDITATTSTADGLTWQSLTTSAQVTAEAALRAAGDAANAAALSGYSNHVRTVYLRGVDSGGGVFQLYQGN